MIINKIQVSCMHLFQPISSSLEISPTNLILLKTFGSKFQAIEVCFTDQNSQPLEIEDIVNLTLLIK